MNKNRAGLAVAVIIAFAFVASLLASNYNAGVQDNHLRNLPTASSAPTVVSNTNLPPNPLASTSGANDEIIQGAGLGFPSVAFHSVASVEKTLNITLVLPSSAAVSAISPSLKLLGVAYNGKQSPQQWSVTILYSDNQTFVNGTSTIADLGSNGISLAEASEPLGVNSSEFAHDVLSPGISTVCTTSKAGPNSASTVQCQTSTDQSNYPNDYIVTQNGLSILVNPAGGIQWADGGRGVWVGIESSGFVTGSAAVPVPQLLSLASTMTTSP